MRNAPSPISSGPATLADLCDQGIDVFCWCNRCHHHAILPAAMLMAQMGPAMAVPTVGSRLVCSGCGAKDIATRPAWPSSGPISRHSPLAPHTGAETIVARPRTRRRRHQ